MDNIKTLMEPVEKLLTESMTDKEMLFVLTGYISALYRFSYIGEKHFEKIKDLIKHLFYIHCFDIAGKRVNFAQRIKYRTVIDSYMKEVYEL